MKSVAAGGTIRYLPTEIQARFTAWAETSQLALEQREARWAEYVDARDSLPPGSTAATTKARAQGDGLVAQPKLYQLNKKTPGHVYQ